MIRDEYESFSTLFGFLFRWFHRSVMYTSADSPLSFTEEDRRSKLYNWLYLTDHYIEVTFRDEYNTIIHPTSQRLLKQLFYLFYPREAERNRLNVQNVCSFIGKMKYRIQREPEQRNETLQMRCDDETMNKILDIILFDGQVELYTIAHESNESNEIELNEIESYFSSLYPFHIRDLLLAFREYIPEGTCHFDEITCSPLDRTLERQSIVEFFESVPRFEIHLCKTILKYAYHHSEMKVVMRL